MKVVIENLTREQAICIKDLILEESANFIDSCFERRIPGVIPEKLEETEDSFIIYMQGHSK